MEGEMGRKGGERRRKEVKGEEVGGKKRGWKQKGEEMEGGSEGRDGTPLFWYKVTPMSASDIHTRRIGLATSNQSALFMTSINRYYVKFFVVFG